MSKEDFIDMVRNNMRNQTREFAAIIALTYLLMVMGYFEPEDNATKAEKNFFRYSKRTLARFSQELMFFYNPAEWNSLLSQGLFPSLGLFDEIGRFYDHFMRETTGMDGTMYATLKKGSTPSKVRKQAQPVNSETPKITQTTNDQKNQPLIMFCTVPGYRTNPLLQKR